MSTDVFLTASPEEMHQRGWDRLDVILVTGDAYIDSPLVGVAVIGRVLEAAGYRVGVIAQPDTRSSRDITRLGEPRLFWGVTAGCVDSMVANYTATRRPRTRDDYTPGGRNTRRPDRACIVYCNLIRRFFKPTVPIVLGGIEASLRRIAHFDFWDNRVRRSLLFDARADILVCGMGEETVMEIAGKIENKSYYSKIEGICYISREHPGGYMSLPSHERVAADVAAYREMTMAFLKNCDARPGRGLVQAHGDRLLVQTPLRGPCLQAELDRIHALPFTGEVHPLDRSRGSVRARDTIRFSIATHRGCYGGCRFCAIGVHQGRTVQWRSPASIVREVQRMTTRPGFRGIISDVGGPTANMYGFECRRKLRHGPCPDRQCLYPDVCPHLHPTHEPQIALLRQVRALPGVRRIFVASGVRCDLVQADVRWGQSYIRELAAHHVSGQLKVAPEHCEPEVLRCMGKPGPESLLWFRENFRKETQVLDKKQYLTYYLMAAHPGCTLEHMRRLRRFVERELYLVPEQVQVFTPTPSTLSTSMYYTGIDPDTGSPVFVERDPHGRQRQKDVLSAQQKKQRENRGARNRNRK